MALPIVAVDQVRKRYGETEVLKGVSMTVSQGERLVILGKSGSGKSTLLHLIGGMDIVSSGDIKVDGVSLGGLSRNKRSDYRLNTIGIIFQSFHLIGYQTALENVEVPLKFQQLTRRERIAKAEAALGNVGLGHRLRHKPSQLSGGERQRVAIARALVNRPRIILADEPTGNLDSSTGQEVIGFLLKQLDESQSTLIMVTHDEEMAQRIGQRVLRMTDGHLTTTT